MSSIVDKGLEKQLRKSSNATRSSLQVTARIQSRQALLRAKPEHTKGHNDLLSIGQRQAEQVLRVEKLQNYLRLRLKDIS